MFLKNQGIVEVEKSTVINLGSFVSTHMAVFVCDELHWCGGQCVLNAVFEMPHGLVGMVV